MLRVLFAGYLKNSKHIIDILNRYVREVQSLEFERASQCINICLKHLENEQKWAKDAGDETRQNQLYVVRQFLVMLHDYSLYWNKILDHDFVGSWATLQNVQDKLRVVKRCFDEHEKAHLDLLECQVVALEKLYPYKIFASPELVISDVMCSICGKNMDSLECPHIRGELYSGEMAYGIVGKIEMVKAVCLVEYPVDKRCVAQFKNTETVFPAVAYLANLITQQGVSPWQFAGVKESMRQKTISEFGKVGRNDECPCGSGKKFKHCHIRIGYIELPHIEILVNQSETPVFELFYQ